MKRILPLFLLVLSVCASYAQVTLGTSPYTQNFNSLSSGLPSGFSIRTGASASSLGTSVAFSSAAIAWNNTTGGFKNFASATDLTATSTSVQQSSSTNRSLGLRQTGTLGDPGAALVLQLANTANLKDFQLSFKLQSVDVTSPRVTTWKVDYGFGSSPVSFTAVATTGVSTTGGSTFSNNTVTVDFAGALNNKNENVWIRIVALTPSTGSGNRPSSAVDDLSLSYSPFTANTASLSATPSSLSFGNQSVNTTAVLPYTINYADLNGSNVSVNTTAPFAVSKSNGGPFTTTLTYTAAELSGSSSTLYAQFSPSIAGAFNGTISHTGGGLLSPVLVSVTGNGVNPNPIASNDSFNAFDGETFSGNVSTNDSDPNGLSLSFSKLTDPATGLLTLNSNGTFTYLAPAGTTQTQTFTYRVSNSNGATADATVTINISEKPRVIISQYYEGTSVNKWIELTNLGNSSVNTASPQLKLGLYSISGDAGNINISGNPVQSFNLNVVIPARGSVLIGNTGNGTEVSYLTAASANQTSNSVINFNGNDGIALLDANNNIIDAFGQGVNAKDISYIRNETVTGPNPSFNVNDWSRITIGTVQNAEDSDDPARLGAHVQPVKPACVTPASQPTNLVFSSVNTRSITISYTAVAGVDEYLIVRSLNNTISANPIDGTAYNLGNAFGGGTVIAKTGNNNFTDANLANGTTFYYFIYAINNSTCSGGPLYLATNPLSGTQATVPLPACVVPSTQATNFNVTYSNYNVIQGTFSTSAGVDEYLVVMSRDSILSSIPANQTTYSVGDSIGGGLIIKKGSAGSFSKNGLAQNTTYYFNIFSVNSNCNGGPLYLTASPLTGRQKTGVLNSSTLNFYYGNLHSHSSFSDGNKDDTSKKPADDYAFAKNSKKMDFLGLSEHNHTQAGMRLANWQPGIDAAKNATTPEFVALHGMEWGVISGGGHVIVYGIDSLIGWEPGENQIYVPKNTYTGTAGLFSIINRHGLNAIATLAHPNTSDYNNISATYDLNADNAIVGSALESGPAFSTNTTYSDPASSMSYLSYYNRMLAKGYHLGASVDHDNHNLTFGRHTRARLVILAPSLTENDLLDGMKKMRFYASQDSAARISFVINKQPVGSVFTGNGLPKIEVSTATTHPVTSIKILYGTPGNGITPAVIASSVNGSLAYTDSTLTNASTGYYYADILESDGSRIITSPIWYTRDDSFREEQVITFNALPGKTFGDPDFTPVASSSSSLPISFSSSNSAVATIVDGKIHITGAGTTTITASNAGNSFYLAAKNVTQQLVIAKANQVIVFDSIAVKSEGDPDFELMGSSNSGLAINYTSSDTTVARINGNKVTIAGPGSSNITASQAGDTNYNPATSAAQVLTVRALPAPIISANGNLSFCPQDSVVLTSTPASSYQWFKDNSPINAEVGRSIVAKISGSYSVEVTFQNGLKKRSGVLTVDADDTVAPTVLTRNISVNLINGTAVVSADSINNGSSDDCGIASISLNKTNFDCSTLGNNPVTLLVTDKSGNTSTGTAIVTVTGDIPAPQIALSRTDNTFTGQPNNTIVLGYGAQKLTLSASSTGSQSQFTWSPSANLSSTTGSTVQFAPTQAGTYTISLEAKNQFGCIAQATTTIQVIDARCGNKLDKVLVCKGGDKNQENCISPNAVQAHLKNGGKLGACVSSSSTLGTESSNNGETSSLRAYPNPFNKTTTVSFNLPKAQNEVILDLYDLNGNKIKQLFKGSTEANKIYNFPLEINSGIEKFYLLRLVYQDGVQTFRIVKD